MKTVLISLVLFLVGCSSTNITANSNRALAYSDTMEMIRMAAESAPKGVEGEYTLKIEASGRQRGVLYLNTELDYRDQRNITVSIKPEVAVRLSQQYGQDPAEYLIGKSIVVEGRVERKKIYFIANGQFSEKYYYQTHISVVDTSQIKVVDKPA